MTFTVEHPLPSSQFAQAIDGLSNYYCAGHHITLDWTPLPPKRPSLREVLERKRSGAGFEGLSRSWARWWGVNSPCIVNGVDWGFEPPALVSITVNKLPRRRWKRARILRAKRVERRVVGPGGMGWLPRSELLGARSSYMQTRWLVSRYGRGRPPVEVAVAYQQLGTQVWFGITRGTDEHGVLRRGARAGVGE